MTQPTSAIRAFSTTMRTAAAAILLTAPVPLFAQAAEKLDGNRIGRSASPQAPEFRAMYAIESAAVTLPDATFPYESRVHRAHVVMLVEQGIITAADGAVILAGLDKVDARAATDASIRTYLPYEKALIEAIGPVAGRMHTGRSRNDLANTVNRMFYRDQVDRIVGALLGLRAALHDKAMANRETVMVVYTHRKQAQPITLGHYFMAISESLGKTINRYEQLRERIDQSPLGAAASAGTGWPLDRSRTAELLGFPGLVENTIESTAGWDHIAELAFVDSLCLTTLGRMASEIQLWSTDEYAAAELDGAFAGTSSIMPQKKNPDSLERTRQQAATSLGPLVSILSSLQAIEYQHSVTRVPLEPRYLDAVAITTANMAGVVRTLHPDVDRMRALSRDGFANMTELADTIVRETGISFREAHEIIAHVVDKALARGLTGSQIDLAMVQQAAQEELGRTLPISAEAVRAALDPTTGVERRNGVGGPAPASVLRAIERARKEDAATQARLDARRQALDGAGRKLAAAIARISRAAKPS